MHTSFMIFNWNLLVILYLILVSHLLGRSVLVSILTLCCKSFELFGFISRVSREFHLSFSLKTLYCALVCPILEYGSIIWDRITYSIKIMLDRLQGKCLRLAVFDFQIQFPRPMTTLRYKHFSSFSIYLIAGIRLILISH